MQDDMNDTVFPQLAREAAAHWEDLRKLQVEHGATPEEVLAYLNEHFDFGEPIAPEALIPQVSDMLRRWTVHVTSPRYYGLFNPTTPPISVAADALVALYNPNLAVWSHSPAANQMEWHTLDYLTRKIGWDPERTVANFTSGGQEANHSAVAAALCRDFPEYVELGLQALDRKPTLYVSDQTHLSFIKIAQLMGLGRDALRIVPTNAHFAMDSEALVEQVEADRATGHLPFLVVATAGTTGIGAVDPLAELADVVEELGLWYHVDAAWGGTALLSPTLRKHLAGIERADSVTWDAHKWLSVPMAAGMFFCRHPHAATKPFQVFMDYVPEGPSGIREPVSSTFQWTRRFIGLKVFMVLAEAGEVEIARRIDHQGEMGDLLRQRLEEDGWQIVNRTPFPLVCFTRDRVGDGGQLSVDEVVDGVNGSGRAWISKIPVPGHGGVLRACITSYLTEPDDLDVLMVELKKAIGSG